VATITEADLVEEIKFHFLDNMLGDHVGIVVFKENTAFALQGDPFVNLLKIADIVYGIEAFRNIVGQRFIFNTIIDWAVLRFRNEILEALPKYIEDMVSNAGQYRQVWIPVPFALSEVDFVLGKTSFRTITSALITEWIDIMPGPVPKAHEDDRKLMFEDLRDKYQGHLAGTFTFTCEISRALELSYQYLADSLSVLRLFSPANTIPELANGLYEYGWKMYESKQNIIFSPPPKPELHVTFEILGNLGHWTIEDRLVNALASDKYKGFHELLINDKKTQFQEKLLDSIRIYSRHMLRNSMFDKLLYIFTAIESLLLKNDSEPIQTNLSDRIAFMLSSTIEGRRSIVKLVKEVYSIRSRYVHHGNITVEADQSVREFLRLVWGVFVSLVGNKDNFTTKDECIKAIEDIKYS
jgi:hypothetical protein